MEDHEARPWKRRRRRENATPLYAKLLIDERMKGDVGIINKALYESLFRTDIEQAASEVRYIALCPWPATCENPVDDLDWSVLPVNLAEFPATGPSVKFSARSLVFQSFQRLVQSSALHAKNTNSVEVLALDVQPLELDTVFLRVDGEAIRKHHDVQKKFGGGFTSSNAAHGLPTNIIGASKRSGGQSKDVSSTLDPHEITELKEAVRSSLGRVSLIHRHDLVPLPLPSHPITHVPFPPVEVLLCEPVSQGLVLPKTEIVVEIDYKGKVRKKARDHIQPDTWNGTSPRKILLGEDSDANDQFYSAAENDEDEEQQASLDESGPEGAEKSDSDETSSDDNSPDNMISLSSPMLPPQASGILSSRTAATPRPFGARATGANSPGSVHSSFTATTANPRGQQGRPFRLRPLVAPVPDFILHPRPKPDEDNEARVFVDVKMLVRLGCFSGDWVRLNTTVSTGADQQWDMAAFADDNAMETFRPVKVYGLSELNSDGMSHYPKTVSARRQSHHSLVPASRPLPCCYVSPILFANLGEPSKVTLTLLSRQPLKDQKFSKSKVPSSSMPPIAKELTLFRVPTPLATERATSAGIFANLKYYFESRRRFLREGDMVAVKLDAAMSRILSDGGLELEVDSELEELLLNIDPSQGSARKSTDIAWFKVGQISGVYPDDVQADTEPEVWGGIASAEPLTTKMFQAGSASSRLPSSLTNPWPYYLGSRRRPAYNSSRPGLLLSQESLPKRRVSLMQRRVRELLAAAMSPQASQLNVEPLALLLHSTQRNIGKTHLVSTACTDLGFHFYPIESYSILAEGPGGGDVKTEGHLRKKVEFALTCGDDSTVPLIRHVEALTAERMASTLSDLIKDARALVFTTTELDKIPETIRSLFTHELEIPAPDEREREGILNDLVGDRAMELAFDVDMASVAVKTAALVAGDLVDVVERASIVKQERLEDLATRAAECLVRDVIISGGAAARCVNKGDFDIAIDVARKNFADSIGAPKIPNVTWQDVGGLSHVKDAVQETIQLPLERPELFSEGMKKRSGILFYGPPGTGKTLVAKAIATEYSLNFFSVKGPELLNMYIGESEANVRRVFQKARDAKPCVVFFDELDSVAPKRGNQGDSGGVMDRIVSQLLAELDGMSDGKGSSGGVFVIGATNRPDLLDQALLRPGRFDKMLYLGVSDTHEKQLTILQALTRKFALDPELSLRRVAEKLPFTYTGADLYALCSDAMLKAITRRATAVEAKIKKLPGGPISTAQFFDHHATEEDLAVVVTEEDFYAAQGELVSSVRYV